MNEFDSRILDVAPRQAAVSRFPLAAWIIVPLIAIWFQVFVPRFLAYLSYLELPLLVTIYFSMMRREPVIGAVFGSAVGLAQDSLSDHYVGIFGLAKTLVGFIAASLSLRIDVESPLLRLVVTFGLFIFHQVCHWATTRFLVGQATQLQLPQVVITAFLNGVVGVALYLVLDRLKEEAQ